MSPQAEIDDPSPETVRRRIAAVKRELVDMQLADLSRIAEVGMELIERLGRMAHEVEAAPETPRGNGGRPMSADAIVLSFARASRAVRLTYMLQHQLVDRLAREETDGDRKSLDALIARVAAVAPTPEQAAARARKDTAAGVLTDVIRSEAAGDAERHERLVREASECLKDRERFDDILNQPISDIVAHVCAELGIEPDWRWLSTQHWAEAELNSGQVGEALSDFSSPARGGGGPAQPVEGAQPPPEPPLSAPSVTAQERRATFPAHGEGEDRRSRPHLGSASGAPPPTPSTHSTAAPPPRSAPAPTAPPAG